MNEEVAAEHGSHGEAGGDEASPRWTALVVEDDAVYRELLVMALESEGYRAIGAADGAKALELVKASIPDVIILDLLMPVMDGLSFLRALKEGMGISIPTLVHTGLDARACLVDALVAGASEVLAKPAALDEILKRIEGLA
jgi:DNA-binding response OmpR family regulator